MGTATTTNRTTSAGKDPLALLDAAIADLEARLNIQPGQDVLHFLTGSINSSSCSHSAVATTVAVAVATSEATAEATATAAAASNDSKSGKEQEQVKTAAKATATASAAAGTSTIANTKAKTSIHDEDDLPLICKLEFKVGRIVNVWIHEKADKLYCEEIDIGEETGLRQIASGLRPYFTMEQMIGQRLLVMSNIKAKNLVGFKSHGMVLCAAEPLGDPSGDGDGGGERVEFVEPPPGAAIGEVITFDGLPPPQPASAAQVEKKKILPACLDGLKTLDDCSAAWNGHVFMTSAGPCKAKTIAGGVMR